MRIALPPEDAPLEEKERWIRFVWEQKKEFIASFPPEDQEEILQDTKRWLDGFRAQWGISKWSISKMK